MNRKMKAAILRGVGEIEVVLVDIPQVGPHDILVKVSAVGICGSDLHSYRAGIYSFPDQIMGHEFCGVVAEAGQAVEKIAIGDRVTGFTMSTCGSCYWCQRQQYGYCPDLFANYIGYGKPGAMAEYVCIEQARLGHNVFAVPEQLSDEEAATAEPLGTALLAVTRTKPKAGDQVIVIGAGMIGNLIMQAMKTKPIARVIVTEVSEGRLGMAKKLGADITIDARAQEALLPAIQQHTGVGRYHFGSGGMADIVIDAAGAPVSMQQALEFARSQGTVGLVGLPEKPSIVDTSKIVHKDIRLIGIFGSTIPKALDYLAQGLIQTKPLITHRYSLDDIEAAFQCLLTDSSAVKVMIKP